MCTLNPSFRVLIQISVGITVLIFQVLSTEIPHPGMHRILTSSTADISILGSNIHELAALRWHLEQKFSHSRVYDPLEALNKLRSEYACNLATSTYSASVSTAPIPLLLSGKSAGQIPDAIKCRLHVALRNRPNFGYHCGFPV